MSPQTIRRLAVAAVATLGVVMLYLWPTSARSPSGSPQQAPLSTTAPALPPPSSASTRPPPPSQGSPSGPASPYDPQERVDTHRPRPPSTAPATPPSTPPTDRSPATRPPAASTPGRPATPSPPPSSTAPPPASTPGTPSGSATQPSHPPSSTPTPQPCTPVTPTPQPTPTPTTSPGSPQNLEAENTRDHVTLTWEAPADASGPLTYLLIVGSTDQCVTDDTSLVWAWAYDDEAGSVRFAVVTVDAQGNRSQPATKELTRPAADDAGRDPDDRPPSTGSDGPDPSTAPGTPSREESPR